MYNVYSFQTTVLHIKNGFFNVNLNFKTTNQIETGGKTNVFFFYLTQMIVNRKYNKI